VVFLLTIPRPPRPTLFPYTTLFRSHARQVVTPQEEARARGDAGCVPPLVPRLVGRIAGDLDEAADQGRLVDVDVRLDRRRERQLDRKSTRLNSSHLVISYAVFCLKK